MRIYIRANGKTLCLPVYQYREKKKISLITNRIQKYFLVKSNLITNEVELFKIATELLRYCQRIANAAYEGRQHELHGVMQRVTVTRLLSTD